ncbi:hypothetical protein SASPL_111680 [Salvia splendens]|uniref:Uncharacterized protein n=1 Tax=Salvia splendens TaxID=180675 RepID=A0A8X8Y8J5_SALSN|nr:hypothetical protein SASPL_111680 [Salvia splendens]
MLQTEYFSHVNNVYQVMENGPPTIEFEDGTVNVERLLVETQDGNVSVDGAVCFNEKTSDKAIDIREVSCSFGISCGVGC